LEILLSVTDSALFPAALAAMKRTTNLAQPMSPALSAAGFMQNAPTRYSPKLARSLRGVYFDAIASGRRPIWSSATALLRSLPNQNSGTAMRGSTMISTLQWLGVVPLLQPPARLLRQPVLSGAVSNHADDRSRTAIEIAIVLMLV